MQIISEQGNPSGELIKTFISKHLDLHDPALNDLTIRIDQDHISLQDNSKNLPTLTIDFSQPTLEKKQHTIVHNQPLLKAFRTTTAKGHYHIMDTTAGFAKDSISLLLLGYQVTSIELNPIVYAIIQAAHQQHNTNHLLKNWTLKFGNSIPLLKKHQHSATSIDGILIDPMFTQQKQSPLPKKNIQWLKHLQTFAPTLHTNEGEEEWLTLAQAACHHRVVIKRAKHAPYFGHKPPLFSLQQKASRLDVYPGKSTHHPSEN